MVANQGTNYLDRAISVLGLVVYQFGFWATSRHRSHIQWQTVIVGLFMQQAIALFVLKSGASFHIFKWLATLASDFSSNGHAGGAFFFDQETVDTKQWIFVNVVRHIQMAIEEDNNVFLPPAAIAPNPHFLHCLCGNALLSRRYAVGHQALCLVLLQDYEYIWC